MTLEKRKGGADAPPFRGNAGSMLLSGGGVGRRHAHGAASAAAGAALLDGVVGRHGEQRGGRFGALHAVERVGCCAEARIGAGALHDDLQVVGIPALEDDLDRLVVADLTGGDGARDARAFGDRRR